MSSVDGDHSFSVDLSTSSSSSSLDSNAEMGILKTKVNNQAASVFGKPYEAKRAVKFIASPITGGLSYIKRGVGYLGAVAADKYARSTIISGPAGIDAAKIELTREHLQKIEEAETKLETLNSQASGDIAKFLNLAVCAEDYSHTEKALQMLVKQIASSNDSNEVGKLKEAFNASFKLAIVGSNSWTNQKIISLFLKFPMLVSDWNQLCKQGSTVNAKFGREKLIKDSFVEVFKRESLSSFTEKINPQFKEMLKFPELIPEDYWSSSILFKGRIQHHVAEIINEANAKKDTQLISRLIEHIPSSVIPWGNVYNNVDSENRPGIKKALEQKINKDFLTAVTADLFPTIDIAMQGHPEMVDWVQVVQTIESKTGLDPELKESIRADVLAVLDGQISSKQEKAGTEEVEAILRAARLRIDILTKDKRTSDIGNYIDPSKAPAIVWEKLFEVADKHEEVKKKLSDEFHAVIRKYARTNPKIISNGWSLAKRIDWKQILSESKEAEPSIASSAGAASEKATLKSPVAMAAPTGKPADSLNEGQKKALVNQTIIDSLELKDEKFVDEDTARKLLQFPDYLGVDLIQKKLNSDQAMNFFVNEGIESILASDLNDAEKEEKIAEFLNNQKLVSYVDWEKIAQKCEGTALEGLLKSKFEKVVRDLTNYKGKDDVSSEWESCIKCRWFKDIQIDYSSVFKNIDSTSAEVLKGPFHEALLENPAIINQSNWSYVDWTKAFKEIKGDDKKTILRGKFNEYLVSSLSQRHIRGSLVDNLSRLITDNKDEVDWENFNQAFGNLLSSEFKERLRASLTKLVLPDMEMKISSTITEAEFGKWISDRSEFIDWKAACDIVSTCVKTKQETLMNVLQKCFSVWLQNWKTKIEKEKNLNKLEIEYLRNILIKFETTPDSFNPDIALKRGSSYSKMREAILDFYNMNKKA